MSRRKWSIEEKEILVNYFLSCVCESKKVSAKRALYLLANPELYEDQMRKVSAVLGNIRKIYEGADLSHVDSTLIKIFLNKSKELHNPLFNLEKESKKDENYFDTSSSFKLLSANNPFQNVATPTINEDRPGMTFLEYFNNLIENLDFFAKVKWSTIYTTAEINHTTANEIRQGKRQITNIYLFKFIIAMRLNDNKIIASLLKKAGISLRIGVEPDTTVAMAITHKIYNRRYINEYLIHKGYPPLFPKLAKDLNQIPS